METDTGKAKVLMVACLATWGVERFWRLGRLIRDDTQTEYTILVLDTQGYNPLYDC